MQRIVVMGTTGTGKSTFAAQLATKLNLPCIEGDSLIWLPGWQRRKEEEFKALVSEAVAAETWIFDGCYSRQVMERVWMRADTVIWLDYSRYRVHWQVLKRAISDIITGRMVHNGNQESWRNVFFNRRSILLYSLTSYHEHRREFKEIFAMRALQETKRFKFGNPQEAKTWLASLSSKE